MISTKPPHAHLHVDSLSSAGLPPTSVWTGPSVVHGMSTGVQGADVGTPLDSPVAAITAGFDDDEHMPNGVMFSGPESVMLAAGGPQVVVAVQFVRNVLLGKRNPTVRPRPPSPSARKTSAPCCSAMRLTIDIPSPLPVTLCPEPR